MKRTLLVASALALTFGMTGAHASSHREAPGTAALPQLDGTDFYMFRSYETGRQDFVTIVANYLPLQVAAGGPGFYNLDTQALYDIDIDNQGLGVPTMRFRFRFQTINRNIAFNVNGQQIKVSEINVGPITQTDNSAQNVLQTYTLSLVTGRGANEVETPITGPGGQTVFSRPIDYIGQRSIPNYAAYAATFVYPITIPGCATPGRVFAGQRKDPFVVNLSETFDLLNYANPIGENFNNSAQNTLSDKNVTALEIEAPIACLTHGTDPVIGGWTTSSKVLPNGSVKQISRLGNPLVNELVIGLADKDKFNGSEPIGDKVNFLSYVLNPTFPLLVQNFIPSSVAPTFVRNDLVGLFLTGIGPQPELPGGLNQPQHLVHPGDELRLNTAIMPVPMGSQSRLGVIGDATANIPMDLAGYPNGRRPGDDIVDISLRVVMGKLCYLSVLSYCNPAQAPSGNQDYTDGAYVDSTFFAATFPYLLTPITGSPQTVATITANTPGQANH